MGCTMSLAKPWPPTLPVERIPTMSEEQVVLVQVAWRRMEKQKSQSSIVVDAFDRLFTDHPSALKVFIRERRKSTCGSENSVTTCPTAKHSNLSTESKLTQTNISQKPTFSRHHLFRLSKEALWYAESWSSDISDQYRNQWLPDCMFQVKSYDDGLMAQDPTKEFLENHDLRWLGTHFKRISMVLHHIVYILHEPLMAQKWLSALRIGHSCIPGIQTSHYQALMVCLEIEIEKTLGERFYGQKTRKAMRKFLTVIFGYLSGRNVSFTGSPSDWLTPNPSFTELNLDNEPFMVT